MVLIGGGQGQGDADGAAVGGQDGGLVERDRFVLRGQQQVTDLIPERLDHDQRQRQRHVRQRHLHPGAAQQTLGHGVGDVGVESDQEAHQLSSGFGAAASMAR